MIRRCFAGLLGLLLAVAAAARADVDIAPAPRAIRPDGTRDPAPQPTPAKKEAPLEIVERIIKNSNAVGDNLARTDTGDDTRGTQSTILKDIQALIDQQENPPPKPDQHPDKNKDKQDQKPDDMQQKKEKEPTGGQKDMDPKEKGGQSGGGMDQQPKSDAGGRKPRMHPSEDPKDKDGQPKEPVGGKQNQASQMMPKDPKNAGGARPDPSGGDPKKAARTIIPFEDEIVKDVWGHLPDKLRRQAAQYYQQDFMPRYSELLKLYYSSLTEKGGNK